MHQNLLVKKVCTKILFSNNDNIVFDFIDLGIVRFSSDDINIVSVDLNNVNLDDFNFDQDYRETIIHVRFMAWSNLNNIKHIKKI